MDRLLLRASACVPLLAFAGCHDSSSGTQFLAPGANDLGPSASFVLEDGILAALRSENGGDLNGDGDRLDQVLEIIDLRSGRGTVVPNALGVQAGAGFVSFLVPEWGQGRDLNGDQDLLDQVLHVYDARRGTTRNLELATITSQSQDGALLAVAVFEDMQGADLDGDGVLDDLIPVFYEADRQRLTTIALACDPETLRISGRRVVFQADESDARDLNGDGDDHDAVVQVWDADTGLLHNSERACDGVRLDGSQLAIAVREWENGDADLNGNGRTDDAFVEFHDLDTGRTRVTDEYDSRVLGLGGDLVVVALEDPFQPIEFSIYDRTSDTLFPLTPHFTNTPISRAQFDDRRHAFLVDEANADLDLDGDGLTIDAVLHVFDARTGSTRSTGRAAYSAPMIDARRVVFLGLAQPQAARPPTHTSVHVLELATGRVRDLGLMASEARLEDGRILALTPESWQGIDLDGDQRLDDTILQVHDLRSGRTFVTGVTATLSDESLPVELDGDVLALDVRGRLTAFLLR